MTYLILFRHRKRMIRCLQLLIIFFWSLQVNPSVRLSFTLTRRTSDSSGLKTVSWFFNFYKINRKVVSAVIRVDCLLHNTSAPNLKRWCKLSINSWIWLDFVWFVDFVDSRADPQAGAGSLRPSNNAGSRGIAGTHFAGLQFLVSGQKVYSS